MKPPWNIGTSFTPVMVLTALLGMPTWAWAWPADGSARIDSVRFESHRELPRRFLDAHPVHLLSPRLHSGRH
jgi:hypothetical protein